MAIGLAAAKAASDMHNIHTYCRSGGGKGPFQGASGTDIISLLISSLAPPPLRGSFFSSVFFFVVFFGFIWSEEVDPFGNTTP